MNLSDASIILLTFLLALLFLFLFLVPNKTRQEKRPPTPPSLPFIGHLHLIKQPLHRSLQHLSYTYGPIYFLKFGSLPTLVISSPKIVDECFTKNNDIILANRPRRRSGKHLHFEWTTLSSAPYGPFWRNLRRLASLKLFSTFRLNMLADIRLEEMRSLVKELFLTVTGERVKVEIRPRFKELTFNVIMRMLTGKRCFGVEEESKVFRDIMRQVFELIGGSNPVDFFPFLRWLPFQKMERKMIAVRKKMDAFLHGLIEECRRIRTDTTAAEVGNKKAAMVYDLLDLQESDPLNYSDQIIKGTMMIMLTAGTDTSAVTLEWALSLLLNHPDVFQKAREEIDSIIVSHDRLVDEGDLSELPYIHNIVNETLRLFPAAPLLVPHEASEKCTIAGYHVNKGTAVITNAWAIHRDPEVWDEPLRFKPERFEGLDSDTLKSSWIPFGQGRRSCPGANLANKVVALNLASLIQCFDWETVDGRNVDLNEGFGLTTPKATPLEAICRARKCMVNVLSQI